MDAMTAYCCLVTGDRDGAANACARVLDAKEEDAGPERKYIERYCQYLKAALDNDYLEYSRHWHALQNMPHSITLNDALPVDRLMMLGPYSIITSD